MQYTDTSAACINSSAQMHEATRVICNNHRCVCAYSIIQFIVQESLCNIGMLYRARSTEPTTDIRLGHLPQLQPHHVPDDMPGLRTQAKAVVRLAGIMIGHDHQ